MDKISIKIVIAGRSYPLTVKKNEEEIVLKAVNEINTNIQKLQESYAVKDMQDLLAMTSLQLATRSLNQEQKANNQKMKNDILNDLKKLSNSIEV